MDRVDSILLTIFFSYFLSLPLLLLLCELCSHCGGGGARKQECGGWLVGDDDGKELTERSLLGKTNQSLSTPELLIRWYMWSKFHPLHIFFIITHTFSHVIMYILETPPHM